jgi:hypothetical protein
MIFHNTRSKNHRARASTLFKSKKRPPRLNPVAFDSRRFFHISAQAERKIIPPNSLALYPRRISGGAS